ncbi:MAG: extracellular solute-binding protein [Halobacteriales archaeon]
MRKNSGLVTRRRFLTAAGVGAITGFAGCAGGDDGGNTGTQGGTGTGNGNGNGNGNADVPPLTEFRGSGTIVEGRPAPGGTSISDLPDLSGSFNLYIGGGEGGIYSTFIDELEEIYPDFEVFSSFASSSSLAQTIVTEVDAGAPQADLFWSIDASSLAFVAENGAYESLSSDTISDVPESFRGADGAWTGVAGRARSVPYNTDQLSEDDIPDKVADFPDTSALQGTMGWAPTYGAFKSFVTAMRLERGADATRTWLESMDNNGTEEFGNEFLVSSRVADGELDAGFANHYYAMRVKNQRPDAPIDLAFTQGDAGALVDVAGALKIQGTSKGDLVENFVRHLLSAEAQEYFATVSFAYPMIPEVQPVGGLPTIDELSPPDIDLAELANLEPTLELMQDAGVLG